MSASTPTPGPDALMLLGTHCPYCPTVLKGLEELVKSGVIGKLVAVNIEQHPEVARELKVRSVPWVRIGQFELEGLRSEKELRMWAEAVHSESGIATYLDELLSTGKIDQAIRLIKNDAGAIKALLALFSNPETQLNTRIGISAIMEHLAGSDLLHGIVDELGELSRHDEARIRGDSAHYLGLTGSRNAVSYLQQLTIDTDRDVRAVAAESLELLDSRPVDR
jgi:thiol-disulfide isomerase/thioredoxin